jgi:FkbM family methyltransferase
LKTVKTLYGDCTFYGKDTFIGRSLYHYGEWGGDEASKIVSLANGGRCLDIGANVGFMSMAMLSAGCTVDAFEPQPALFELLKKNTLAFDKAYCSNVALSSKCGVATMPRIRYGSKGNYGALGLGQRSELGTISVECKTLDSLYTSVDFIKIDVEGHELEVLRGGADLISSCKPIMYIEDDRPALSVKLREFILKLGYKIEEHRPKLYRANNYAGYVGNIWGEDYESHNIICSR